MSGALFGGDTGAAASGRIGALDGQAPSGGSTTFTVTVPGSGMVFNNTITSSTDASLQTAITQAEDTIGANWTNSFTLNLSFSAVNKGSSGFLATNNWPAFVSVTYSQLKSALAAHDSGSVYAQDFVASLPATSPIGSTTWELPEAYARMLGLSSTNYATDDTVTLNTFYLNGSGQDVTNALMHEISEGGMGRVAGDGDQNSVYSTVDLMRYTAGGQLDLTDGRDSQTTYFSYNGGATTSQSVGLSFNNEFSGSTKVNSNDVGDFTQLDVFGVGESGETFGLSQTDIELMDALGWAPALATNLREIGTGNFGGTDSDIQWQNTSTNAPTTWLMNGATANVVTEVTPPAPWQLAGVGDFNSDGNADLVWHIDSTGNTTIWLMNGTSITQNVALPTPPPSWQIVGTGDFYDTGFDNSILWQNSNGDPAIWEMNGTTVAQAVALPNPGPGWQLIGTGDFFGTGFDNSILLQANGWLTAWEMSGSSIISSLVLPDPPSSWHVGAIGDVFGDGHDDGLAWQNSNGAITLWQVNSGGIASESVLPNPGPSWTVQGAGDFNGDGTADLLLTNSSGSAEVWSLNHGQFVASTTVTT